VGTMFKIHIDTLATRLIMRGIQSDIKELAIVLKKSYDSKFINSVITAKDTEEDKRECLLLYIEERYG